MNLWTFSIVWNTIEQKRSGNWICFRLQVSGGGHLLCWVPPKERTSITGPLRLVLSKRSNRIWVFLLLPEEVNGFNWWNDVFSSYLEFRAMYKVQKPSYSESYTPSSQPSKFYSPNSKYVKVSMNNINSWNASSNKISNNTDLSLELESAV
jgi:hypothetical protein